VRVMLQLRGCPDLITVMNVLDGLRVLCIVSVWITV